MGVRNQLVSFGLCAALLVVAGSAEAWKDVVIPSSFAGLPSYGRFAVHKAVEVAEVVDERLVRDPTFLGEYCEGLFRIVTEEKPEVYTRAALEKTLDSLGLRRQAGEEPALRITARIWRARARCIAGVFVVHRAELNISFDLSTPAGERIGTAYVLGDAQTKTATKVKKTWAPLFAEALTDAMEELASSDVLRQALGPEVVASFEPSVRARMPPPKIVRIDDDNLFGPSGLFPRFPRVDLSGYSNVELDDFEMGDEGFVKEHTKEEVAAACAVVPAMVYERLAGLYPGLFTEVTRAGRSVKATGASGKRMVIRGRFRDFQADDFLARAAIGFGAAPVSFDVDLEILDAETREKVVGFRIHVIFLRGGGEVSQLEDTIDKTAGDIVYYLQQTRDRTYVSPVIARHTPKAEKAAK